MSRGRWRVRSAVARLVPIAPSPLEPDEHRPFGEFTTGLFSHRRKVLPTALRLAVEGLDAPRAHALVRGAGLSESARVGEVAPERLLALWRRVDALGPPRNGAFAGPRKTP